MIKIKIEDVVNHLEDDLKRVLAATIEEHFPNQNFDSRSVFRTFKKEVYKKCRTWESIPERFVK
ncbi:hypothetical protein [Sphingobacterium siyangense]